MNVEANSPKALKKPLKRTVKKPLKKQAQLTRRKLKRNLEDKNSKSQPSEIKSMLSQWLKTYENRQVELSPVDDGYGRFMAVLACTSYLVFTFGRNRLEELLEAYEGDGWISEGTSRTIKNIAKTIFKEDEDFPSFRFPFNGEPTVEDYLLAAILLNMLARGGDNIVFLVILLVVGKLMDRFPYAKDFTLKSSGFKC
jgi:archaellum component FlaD/FlaE